MAIPLLSRLGATALQCVTLPLKLASGQFAPILLLGHSLIKVQRLLSSGIHQPVATAVSGALNYVAGDKELVALAAQILHIARIRLDIANAKKELHAASLRLISCMNGSYKLPMGLLQDASYLDPKNNSLIQKTPQPVAWIALKSHYITEALANEALQVARCAYSYIELASAFYDFIDLQEAGGKFLIANNLAAIGKEFDESPLKVIEEIESHQGLIDAILRLTGYKNRTKDLTDAIRRNMKTIEKVQTTARAVSGETHSLLQRSVFVLADMCGLHTAPLGLPEKPEQSQPHSTLRTPHDDQGSTDKTRHSQRGPKARFYKRD